MSCPPAGELVRFIETGGEPQNVVFDGTDLIVADFGELPQYGEGGLAASGPACGRLLRVPAGRRRARSRPRRDPREGSRP